MFLCLFLEMSLFKKKMALKFSELNKELNEHFRKTKEKVE